KQKDFGNSNFYLEKAYAMCMDDDNYKCMAVCLINIGENFYENNQMEQALDYYNRSLEIVNKYEFLNLKLYLSPLIGLIYQNQKRFGESLDAYYAALNIAKELNYLDQQIKIYEHLVNVAVAKRDYHTALQHEKKRSNLIDSIHKMQKKKEIKIGR